MLPESEKRKFIAREILSEQFAMFGESARHGIIRKARNTVLKKDYFRDKFLGMEIDKLKFNTLGRMRKTLEQVGVKFDLAGNPRGDMTATSVIFKDPKTGRQMVADPGVEHLIAQYIIEKDQLVNRVSETSEVGGSEMTFKASDAAKKNADGTPKVPRAIIERWAESGWVKTDKSGDILNSTGGKWQPGQRPAFTTAKERTRMDKDRVAALVAALEPVTKQIGDEEESVGAVRWRVNKTDGGKNFSGSYFDDAQMKAIMDAPDDVVQPAFKKNIEMLNEAVKTREGQPFLADYWKAITGRGYDSKARMKVQLFTPIGMEISSAGNFNATIFNIGYFENKINRWLGQSGKKKFWKEWADEDGRVDVDAFRRDVNELLGTHFADDRNVRYPDNTKKEKMYSFLGVKPFNPGRKDWNTSVKDRKMIQKFRADRMKNLTPGMGDNFPISFGKAKDRYMPGEPARPPVDDLGFYSRVAEVAAGDKIPARATGDQMLATIAKQPGVKKEEIAWLGLEEFLRGKDRVTKDELGEFIRENDVRLEETVFEEKPDYVPHRLHRGDPTQYGEYQLPGAEPGSYREMVLRLPEGDKQTYKSSHWNEPNVLAHVRFNDRTGPNGEKILFVEEVQSDWHREGRERGYARPKITELPDRYMVYERLGVDDPFKASHEKLLDDSSYSGNQSLEERWAVVLKNQFNARVSSSSEIPPTTVGVGKTKESAIANAVKKYNRARDIGNEVPDAPFKTSWHELAMKRMLRHAAENGYEKLAWISGDETAKRYDLSTKVGKLVVSKSEETGKIAFDADGELVDSSIDPKKLESYVGKEVAKRALDMLENESPDMGGNKSVELTGDDLQVGGQWAYNLYDRMIPQFMKKYGKKFGAKVEDAAIDLGGYKVNKDNNALPYRLEETDSPTIISRHATAEDAWIAAEELSSNSFKAIDITPAMRGDEAGSVVGGQVKFMPGVEKFDTIEPSIISESVKIKPGAFDNVRFMPGSPAKIPLSKIAESDPFIMASDQMADMVYTVPGSGVRIELHGGPAFSYRDGRAVWASTKNAATKIGNYVIRSGKNRALIMIQRADNHAKNPSMGRVFVEELKAREKNITKTDMNKMLRAASKRAGLKKSIKNLVELEDAYQFWDWDTRGNFFGQFGLSNKPHSPIGDPRKRGFFDYHQIVKDTADPAFADLPVGTVVGAIEFDGGKTYSASELGTVPHTSYDTMLKGRGLGLFENPPHISEILDVPESQRSVFTLSRRFTSPNRLKETAQAEVDNIIKMPAEEKAKRKDRAQELLKKFIEQ
jgi:hypothetical protein